MSHKFEALAPSATLASAVGHIPGTARPGERGTMAFAGHGDSFFRELRRVKVRDAILVHTAARQYYYLVDLTEVVGAMETRVLDPTGDAVLTPVTCDPFEYVGHAPNRFIVCAWLSAASRHRPAPSEGSGGS